MAEGFDHESRSSLPILPVRTIVASQSSSVVYQISFADFSVVFPSALAEASCGGDKFGVVESAWPQMLRLLNRFELKDEIGIPQKLTVKVAIGHAQNNSTLDFFQAELRVLTQIWESVGRMLFQHLPLPVAVVKFKRSLESDEICIGLVQSYVKACPLHNLSYRFPDGITSRRGPRQQLCIDFCRDILFQIAHIMKHLNSNGFLFRDLKLPNVLVNCYGRVTLVDFGHCVLTEDLHHHRGTLHATTHTSAPELFRDNSSHAQANYALADLWSFGVVAYEWIYARRMDIAAAVCQENRVLTAENQPNVWWRWHGCFDSRGYLSGAFFGAQQEQGGGRARVTKLDENQSALLHSQLQSAEAMIRALLAFEPRERLLRFGAVKGEMELGSVWDLVLSHAFFEGSELWCVDEGFLKSCTEEIEEEVDMQTLGM